MKTAISVPDATYAQVEVRVEQLGISRSQFYATAAERYLRDLERDDTTDRVNRALDLIDGGDTGSELAVTAGRRMLEDGEEW